MKHRPAFTPLIQGERFSKLGKHRIVAGNLPQHTVGSLNGIYGIISLFPAPMGSATEPTGILLMKLAMKVTSVEDFFEKNN